MRGLLAELRWRDSTSLVPPLPASGLPDALLPCQIQGVAVRLYHSGLSGYGLALGSNLDATLRAAVEQAAADPRFRATSAIASFVVSILHHPEPLGNAAIGTVGSSFVAGSTRSVSLMAIAPQSCSPVSCPIIIYRARSSSGPLHVWRAPKSPPKPAGSTGGPCNAPSGSTTASKFTRYDLVSRLAVPIWTVRPL